MMRYDIITSVPVPFRADQSIDMDAWCKVLHFVSSSGNEGVFILGTTGEFASLSVNERVRLARTAIKELSASTRVIVNVGTTSFHGTSQLIDSARADGVREIAVVTPYYQPSDEESLYEYFSSVAQRAAGLDIYIYVFPARTGNPISTHLMGRLALIENVVGAKVSGEPVDRIAEYRAVVPDDFILYTGSDRDFLESVERGAQGVVSGVSSVFPLPFRNLVKAVRQHDRRAIATSQEEVNEAIRAIAGGNDIAKMKEVYKQIGIATGAVRMVVARPTEEERRKISELIRKFNI